jgi:hypothetical protein
LINQVAVKPPDRVLCEFRYGLPGREILGYVVGPSHFSQSVLANISPVFFIALARRAAHVS